MSKGSKELIIFQELMDEYIYDYNAEEREILSDRWLMMYYNELKQRKNNKQ